MTDDEFIQTFWATSNFSTICFNEEEVRSILDSTLDKLGQPTEYSNQGFGKYILKEKISKSKLIQLEYPEILALIKME